MRKQRKRFRTTTSLILVLAMVLSMFSVAGVAEATIYEGNTELARQAGHEGMVLLENHGGLPLTKGRKVATFGKGQIDYQKGGGGSGTVNTPYVINIIQGLQNKEKEGKISIYKPLVDAYTKYLADGKKDEMPLEAEEVKKAAEFAETAIVVISRYSSEGSDVNAGKGSFYLSDAETDMLNKVTTAGFDKVVVLLNIGSMMDTSWITNYPGISVMHISQLGMEGGNAVADVLVGEVSPSGKLVDTYAKSYEDYPSADNFDDGSFMNYEEDIFVGYRYFETFDPKYEKVNYEFGYGLSYTTFEITLGKVEKAEDKVTVNATVENTGKYKGKEVVQVYASAPQGKLGKPGKELVGFKKTKELGPGEKENLQIEFDIKDLASFDDLGKVKKSAYILEAGDYKVFVGNSIKDAGKNLAYVYNQAENRIVKQLSSQVAPKKLDKRLLADGSYEELKVEEDVKEIKPVVLDANSNVIVEAEDYTLATDADHKETGFLRKETTKDPVKGDITCIAYFNRENYLEYDLDVKEAGDYYIILNVANGRAALNNTMDILVNGTLQEDVNVMQPQTGDGQGKREWYNFLETAPVKVNLPKGMVKLRLVSNGQNGNIDYLRILKKLETDIKASGKNLVEAEHFSKTESISDKPVRTEMYYNAKGEGGISIGYMNYKSNMVEYDLNVEKAGKYALVFRAANGYADIYDMLDIYVNDKAQDVKINLKRTGDGNKAEWFNFIDTDPSIIELPQGNVKLRLVSRGPSGNIDNMTIQEYEEFKSEKDPLYPDPKVYDRPITFEDYYYSKDEEVLDKLVKQLKVTDMMEIATGKPAQIGGGTGTIGIANAFGIPEYQTADGPAGVRLHTKCTAWPVSMAMSTSWNLDLVEQVGAAIGKEAVLNGVHYWLAPGMNIHRNPRCGRNFEYYSEDPFLTGKMAASITKGVQENGAGTVIKHFAANNREKNRNSTDSRMSERALREIYLRGFRIAIEEAQPAGLMTSYNFLNGVETSENPELLKNILRAEWGYKGVIMTDWRNNSTHFVEVLAGNNVKMPQETIEKIKFAFDNKAIGYEDLVNNTKEIVRAFTQLYKIVNKVEKDEVLDLRDLKIAMHKAEDIDAKKYANGEELTKALNEARTWLENNPEPKTSPENKAKIYELKKKINDAVDNLENILDTSDLKDKIQEAESIDRGQYLDLSKLDQAINEAKKWLENEKALGENEANIEKKDELIENIDRELKALLKVLDTTELELIIDVSKKINDEDYVDTKSLRAEIKKAEDFLAKADRIGASPENIEEYKGILASLRNAIDNLVEKTDTREAKELLKEQVELAKSLDLENKTDNSVKELKDKIQEAEEVLQNEDASKEEISQMISDLVEKMVKLEEKEKVLEGWQYEDGNWYYYEEGKPVISSWRFVEVKRADGSTRKNWKYFNRFGHNIEKFYKEKGNTHLSLVGPNRDYAKGWYKLGRAWTYYKGSWGVRAEGEWLNLPVTMSNGEIKLARKYFNKAGYSVSSFYRGEDNRGYYSQSGPDRYLYYGWKTLGNHTYYFWNPSGRAAVGRVTVRGEIRTFNSLGILQK